MLIVTHAVSFNIFVKLFHKKFTYINMVLGDAPISVSKMSYLFPKVQEEMHIWLLTLESGNSE